ncbi:hypothetical protein [Lactobacillus hominis]|uniref:hypothetical protein n=1 Tax=Lactobacillus hominis TaxID=1203033 RepID=UPI0023F12FFA|nr:hypothetical protein [Lactobacillus hominis]
MKLKAFLTGFSAVAILLVSGCSNSHSASKESNVEKETSASVSNDIEFGKDEDGKPLFFSDIYGSRKDSKIDYNVGYNAYMGQKTTYIDSLHVEKMTTLKMMMEITEQPLATSSLSSTMTILKIS